MTGHKEVRSWRFDKVENAVHDRMEGERADHAWH